MVHFVLILMLMIGVSTGACPIMCQCRNYPRDSAQKNLLFYSSVSCSTYSVNITSALDNSTRDFQISNFSELELEDVFISLMEDETELSSLTNLIITKSKVGNLNSSVEGLERIVSLTLTDNSLEVLPEAFLNLSNLQTMDLSLNEIKVIELEPFRTLRTLEVLNLSANSLNKIGSDSFSGLNVLKCLDLSRNYLTKLEDQVLLPLSSLQYLNLSNNHLESLNEMCFSSLIMLQQLDVSWNRLAHVAPGSLQLPSLARLLLAGNPQLGTSREAAVLVGTGRRLQTVDASRTGLKQVPAALTHSIRTLRLAGNSIKTVSCGDLDSYPLLQLLDFTSNNLEIIEEDALGRLDSLAVLYLTDNSIHEIPKSLPEKLKVLHLEHNDIRKVSGKDLQGLTTLEVLLLSDNKIRVVEEAAFSQLFSLVTLDLSRNPVTILQPGCLAGPSALQVLRLSSIGIISPAEEVSFPLSTPEHLITLDLSGSPGLARQLLADTAALAASRELQELDLSRNKLEFIRYDLLHYLPQLRLLHIRDNSLNCSQLQWLAAWLRRQDEPEYRDVICASPADLWGTPLVDLQDVEISPMQAINQQENSFDVKAVINLPKENATNMYTISGNLTGQYTTESTNDISLDLKKKNVSNLIENVDNYSKEKSSDKGHNRNVTNEVEKFNIKYNKVYLSKKHTFTDSKKNSFSSKKQAQIKNEALMKRQDIKSETISAAHLTTISSVSNDRTLTPQNEIPETTTVPSSTADAHLNAKEVINQTGKVAITETTTFTSEQTYSGAQEVSRNGNETGKSQSNKVERSRVISEISRNLFIAPEEKTFNNTLRAAEKYNKVKELMPGEQAIDEDMTEVSPQWNASTGEMSMYTNNKQRDGFLHPGMLILAAGVLGATAALTMLAARFTRKRRNSNLSQREDIEVTSLPSVTELW